MRACAFVLSRKPLVSIISFNDGAIVVALKTMPISKLLELRGRVEAVLSSKVSEERRALETELAKLTRYDLGGVRTKFGGPGVRGKTAPKYRNPENPSETWAGRGLRPRWLAAAIKAGKNLEDFSIEAPASSKTARKKIRTLQGLPGDPTIDPPKPPRRVRKG